MMRNCNNCLENRWIFKYQEGMVLATCELCGYEVEFETKNKNKRKIDNIGDLCRRCNNPVIFRESKFKPSKLKKSYYYTGYFYCPKCKEMYMSEKFKIIN